MARDVRLTTLPLRCSCMRRIARTPQNIAPMTLTSIAWRIVAPSSAHGSPK